MAFLAARGETLRQPAVWQPFESAIDPTEAKGLFLRNLSESLDLYAIPSIKVTLWHCLFCNESLTEKIDVSLLST